MSHANFIISGEKGNFPEQLIDNKHKYIIQAIFRGNLNNYYRENIHNDHNLLKLSDTLLFEIYQLSRAKQENIKLSLTHGSSNGCEQYRSISIMLELTGRNMPTCSSNRSEYIRYENDLIPISDIDVYRLSVLNHSKEAYHEDHYKYDYNNISNDMLWRSKIYEYCRRSKEYKRNQEGEFILSKWVLEKLGLKSKKESLSDAQLDVLRSEAQKEYYTKELNKLEENFLKQKFIFNTYQVWRHHIIGYDPYIKDVLYIIALGSFLYNNLDSTEKAKFLPKDEKGNQYDILNELVDCCNSYDKAYNSLGLGLEKVDFGTKVIWNPRNLFCGPQAYRDVQKLEQDYLDGLPQTVQDLFNKCLNSLKAISDLVRGNREVTSKPDDKEIGALSYLKRWEKRRALIKKKLVK